MFNSAAASSSHREDVAPRRIRVYDFRDGKQKKKVELETSRWDLNDFRQNLRREFKISVHEVFVLVTTDRTVLDFDKFEALEDGSTIYLLQHQDQTLPAATEEQINYEPHYNTLTQCGSYEYYASEGQASLPYALAELIDNSLSATSKITGRRTIEIRMLFDESLGKPAVIVLDNGCGMTSKQLNNWAVYRLSKFDRGVSTSASKEEGYVRPDHVPRSLNSDISYFGIGGKQAVFYIGNSTRMISKAVGSPDVHELVLSEEEFKKKAKNKKEIYSGIIRNRKPGDTSHVSKDERFLHGLITEERGKESFTAVVITGIRHEHIKYLKDRFKEWTTVLAHTYHYYIHGVNGNDMSKSSSDSDLTKIDIQVTLRERPKQCPRVINLREIDDDMQTQYINTAADTFEFKAYAGLEPNRGTVEGVIRYHPFLYDRETYPGDPYAAPEPGVVEDDNESGVQQQARGKRPIFECFWNGRLIPYTKVSEFAWCAFPRTGAKVPKECYDRISGVLFTNDRFKVTTNKLTFMDLPVKLMEKETIFTFVHNGQEHRNIQKEFTQWLKNCHEKLDKQVKFQGFREIITRTDVLTQREQHPWSTFSSIEVDGKKYKSGHHVKSIKTQPIVYGKVVCFLLYGSYTNDIFATGGQVEISLKPKALYDPKLKTKIIPISKIDMMVTEEVIISKIESDYARLPLTLQVDWPASNSWSQDEVHPAGSPLGPLTIKILNKNRDSMSTMPTVGQGTGIKLRVKLTVIKHGPRDEKVVAFVASHIKGWGYCFKKIGTLTKPGNYTLCLNAIVNDNDTVYEDAKLPEYMLKFTIKEGHTESFNLSPMSSSTFRVGVPFDIPLQLKDRYDNPVEPQLNIQPELKCSCLTLSYEAVDISGTEVVIKGVKARGKLPSYQQPETYVLKVTLPGLTQDTQPLKISLLPGDPHSLHVKTEDDPIIVENRNPANFNVVIHDEAGNITANPKQTVHCKVQGLPLATTDCSTGVGQLVTEPINVNVIRGEPQKLKVEFWMPGQKNIPSVVREVEVMPSTQVSLIEVYIQDVSNFRLKSKEKIEWLAGGLMENLFIRLYDEAEKEVPITAEIASKIKVNWTNHVDEKDLEEGKLPDIQVNKQVQDERFCQVSYQSVSVDFTIVPRPDEPTQLKATLLQETVKLGETLSGISLELVDQYGNPTKSLSPTSVNNMTVEAEGLDKSAIAFKWQEHSSSVEVTGIRLQCGRPGLREMIFTFQAYVERIVVKVSAGDPAELKLVSGPEQPLQVLNDHGIPTPFIIQLTDKWGNPSTDQRVEVEVTSSPEILQVTTDVNPQLWNNEGKAFFTVERVSGPKGYYQLDFKGSFNNKPIPGPSVNLTVLPDPNKPVGLSVEYNTTAKFPAGGTFPVFSVVVVSDSGNPMTTFNPAAASMFLWEGESSQNTPPERATELKCNKPMSNERKDCFHFRGKEIPQRPGRHIIQFSLRINDTKKMFSDQIIIDVVANQPVRLGSVSQLTSPVVTCSKDIALRTLVKNTTLWIMDKYGNPAGQNLDGTVVVSINGFGSDICPLFEGKTNTCRIRLVKGEVHITNLALMENSPGVDDGMYNLLFKPEVSVVSAPLAPFQLTFHFYNDKANQQKVCELMEKKTELTAAIAAQKSVFDDCGMLLRMLTAQCLMTVQKENELKSMLVKRNVPVAEGVSIQDIDMLLREKNEESETILQRPRRVFPLRDNFRGQQDVLGMVGHLACVQDDAAARVISWHIRGDMDCVITKTTEAARKIHRDTRGRQQVMPLDSVIVSQLNRPLPHIRDGRNLFQPLGNPVYARELLIYPNDKTSCDTVFRNILRDTILIDDLDCANQYRRLVVQKKIWCPTILTKDGERISSTGKFGGAQNKAPPMNELQMFGAPLPQEYDDLREQMDLLRQYRTAMDKREKAEKDREDLLEDINSAQTKRKEQELEEKQKELEEIERQLTFKSGRAVKRGTEEAGEPSGIATKRPR